MNVVLNVYKFYVKAIRGLSCGADIFVASGGFFLGGGKSLKLKNLA